VTWVWLSQSEASAGGHAARPPAVPGPLTGRAGPGRPARHRTPQPGRPRPHPDRGPLTPATLTPEEPHLCEPVLLTSGIVWPEPDQGGEALNDYGDDAVAGQRAPGLLI